MAILIDNVVDVHTVDTILATLKDTSLFVDGKKTAGKTAKVVKENLQLNTESKEYKAVNEQLRTILAKHPVMNAASIPKIMTDLIISRYESGMTYGSHMDNAFIKGVRSDLSFTLFLSSPDDYEGGELIIQKHDGDEVIKLPKGSVYVYPSNCLHYVTPVSKGVRHVAVGWIQSRIRLDEQRGILFDLLSSIESLEENPQNHELRINLLKVQTNLMRLWAD